MERGAAVGVGVKVGNGERAAATRRTGHEDVAAGAEVAVLVWIRVNVIWLGLLISVKGHFKMTIIFMGHFKITILLGHTPSRHQCVQAAGPRE